jgi:hypothetical protein
MCLLRKVPMKFEIGKEYVIGNKYKKSVEEFSFLNREKDRMVIEILWRSGEWLVTPQDEDECEILQDAYDNESDMEVCFQEMEFLYTDDGIYEEFKFYGDVEFNEDEQERLKEGYYDEGYCFLEEEGFIELDPEVYIIGGIRAEEKTV